MKSLTRMLIVIAVFAMATQTFAQSFGIKAGLNMSTMLLKDDEDTYSDDFKMKPGFHAGVTAEFPLTDMLSFETGLLLSTKGYKYSGEETQFGVTVEYDSKMSLYYVDIPLTAKAAFEVGDSKIYAALGPYVGIGVSGKYKAEMTFAGETETEEGDVKWGTNAEDDDLKRLDFGLAVGAGVEINSIQIGLNYGYGLANISPYTEGGYKANNRVLGLSVGYKFGGK